MSDDWKRGLMRPYQDIGCTIPAVNPGDKVAAWKNDAGAKIVQPSPDKQPTIRTELEVLREDYAALRARYEKLREGLRGLRVFHIEAKAGDQGGTLKIVLADHVDALLEAE